MIEGIRRSKLRALLFGIKAETAVVAKSGIVFELIVAIRTNFHNM